MGDSIGSGQPGVHNTISGVLAGPSVQAGAVHGGVHLHSERSWETPVPKQLPPAPAHFTGRERELAALDALRTGSGCGTGRPRVVVLTGPGGVGKTALAVHWGHRPTAPQSDGQLFATLDGGRTPDEPRAPSDVLDEFLHSLGVPVESLPVRLSEKAALFRSMTAGRTLTVVLDDAASAAQVTPLLPASEHSTVVVTSRWRLAALAVDGAGVVEVAPLGTDDAVQLMRHTVGDERVAAELSVVHRLVRICDGFPIALRVISAWLALRPSRPVTSVVDKLSNERERLERLAVGQDISVTVAFDVACHALPPEAERLYRLLGRHPGPDFSVPAAAALAGRDVVAATELVEALVDVSLVQETGNDRYRLHDLIRLHAVHHAAQLPAGEEQTALRRVLEWYLNTAVAADLIVSPFRTRVGPRYRDLRPEGSFPSQTEALGWLVVEQPNLVASVRCAADNGMHDIAWELCEAMWVLFVHRRHTSGWITSQQIAVSSARHLASETVESRIHNQLGAALLERGDVDAAVEEFSQALILARSGGHRPSEATALERLGKAFQVRGQLDEAAAHLRAALAIDEILDEVQAVAVHSRVLGNILREAGDTAGAVAHLTRARELAVEMADRYSYGRTTSMLGLAHGQVGDVAKAQALLSEALATISASSSAQWASAQSVD